MNLPRRVGIGTGLLPFLRLLHEPVLLVTNHPISFANEAAWRLFGVERGQLIGLSPLALFHPDSIAKAGLRQRAAASRARGTPVLTEQILLPDGSTRTVHTTVTQISPPPQQLQLLVLHDVSDLQRKRRLSLQGQAELQELGMARVALTDMRRRHLARELHDQLQQSLVAIQLEGAISAVPDPNDHRLRGALSRVGQVTSAAIGATQRIINNIQPLILEELGLVPALESLVNKFERQSGLATRLTVHDTEDQHDHFDLKISTCLYRVAENALSRISGLPGVSRVDMLLEASPQGAWRLCVLDDALPGNEAALTHPTQEPGIDLSLLHMRERMRAIGGSLVARRRPGRGNVLEAWLPMPGGQAHRGTQPEPEASGAEPGDDAPGKAYQLLLSFLYRAPVGMLQASLDGNIELMNPMAAQMLLPLAGEAGLLNLYDLLNAPLPQLHALVQNTTLRSAAVCDGLAFASPGGQGQPARALALCLLKQDGVRLTAVISDESARASDNS